MLCRPCRVLKSKMNTNIAEMMTIPGYIKVLEASQCQLQCTQHIHHNDMVDSLCVSMHTAYSFMMIDSLCASSPMTWN